ncbi:hypothetical protein Ocin01_16918 [Orchesella cincta]|uniref:Protein quiver n=1 Tax=Orchesella cincta TaxID=48709 RepID=A0A1D2M9Z5_ORCCI|nr:hypothetical protein Ocin01_16918 [Orchesella cincta]
MEHSAPSTLATLLTIIVSTEELNCYQCGHIENDLPKPDDWRRHSSCAAGNQPNSKFSTNCNDLDYFEMGSGIFMEIRKDEPKGGPPTVNLPSIMANSPVTLSCITFNIESLPRAAGDNHRSTRSCAVIKGAIKTPLDECYDGNSEVEMVIKQPWLKTAIVEWFHIVPADTKKLGVCTCFSNNCNGRRVMVRFRRQLLHQPDCLAIFYHVFGLIFLFYVCWF